MAKYTDLKNQCWPMVKLCPEIIIFTVFCPEKIKYCPEKKSTQIFEKFTKKTPKFSRSPSLANFNANFICHGFLNKDVNH